MNNEQITLTLSRDDAELVELAIEYKANQIAERSLSSDDQSLELAYRELALRLRDIVKTIRVELEKGATR